MRILVGDLFESQARTLVNAVNCVGAMGKGIAEQFKRRFPAMFDDYKRRCKRKDVRLGEPYLYRDSSGIQIVNFPTKGHWRSQSRIADVEHGLDYLVEHATEWNIASLALPALGCGNGGLEWSQVGPLIYRNLSAALDDGVPVRTLATKLAHLAREPRPLGERARDTGMRSSDRLVPGHCVGVSARDLGDRRRFE